jgi:hypothetical protein
MLETETAVVPLRSARQPGAINTSCRSQRSLLWSEPNRPKIGKFACPHQNTYDGLLPNGSVRHSEFPRSCATLQARINQNDVHGARRQQCQGKRGVHARDYGLRFHARILKRFYRASPSLYFRANQP